MTNYLSIEIESDRPNFAVALATHNGMDWIEEQLDTILNQQGVDVVVFVSDDQSTDNTATYLKSRAELDKRIVVLPKSDSFGGAARNFYRLVKDIELSDFDYLALADQDDCWFDDKLLRAHTTMKQRKVSAYSSNVTAFWPDGRELLLDKSQPQRRWDFLFEAAGPGCSYVFNVKIGLQLQSFVIANWNAVNRITLHDWLFYAYVRSHSLEWFIDSRSGLRYRQHGANQHGANVGWKTALRRMNMIRSGWYRCQGRDIALLCGLDSSPFVCDAFGGRWRHALYLLLHIGDSRRRFRDRVLLGVSCLVNLF